MTINYTSNTPRRKLFLILSQSPVITQWWKTIKMLSTTQNPDSYRAVIIWSWSHFHAKLESVLLLLNTNSKMSINAMPLLPHIYCQRYPHGLPFFVLICFISWSYNQLRGGHWTVIFFNFFIFSSWMVQVKKNDAMTNTKSWLFIV